MRRYSLNVHAVRYTSAFGHSCRLNWLAIVPDEPTRAKGYSSWTPPRPDTLLFRASPPPSSSSATLEASSAPRRSPTPASYLSLRLRRLLRCSATPPLPTQFCHHLFFVNPRLS